MDLDSKPCTACGQAFPRDHFAQHKGRVAGKCPACMAEYQRAYRLANKERAKQKQAEWRANNVERCRSRRAAWAKANPEKMTECRLSWVRRNPEKAKAINKRHWSKKLQQVDFKVSNRIRVRLRETLRAGGGRCFQRLGYSTAELRAHLERQFVKGMSWENMGRWHIDHIVPLSSFTITGPDDPELRRAWALTNLRPLWAAENLKKSDKRQYLL